ncbi:MAG: hypothetical protein IT244_09835 [Bacteroidia bacterium]|nr:hypothetical protein [Bacteroidia bacterium]
MHGFKFEIAGKKPAVFFLAFTAIRYYLSAMISRRFLSTIITCILGVYSLNAQGLYTEKNTGPYVMLFQLNTAQAEFAVHNPYKLDTSFLYTNLVGEVSIDSGIPLFKCPNNPYPIKPISYDKPYKLQGRNNQRWNLTRNGYFIEVWVNHLNQAFYKIIENTVFYPSVVRIGYETYVFVEDSAGLSLLGATVKLDTTNCIYDPSIGGYKIPKKNISGTLFISKNENFTFHAVNGFSDPNNNGTPPRDNYVYDKSGTKGYLVTNKPVYRTGDTVFFKAFLVNKKAKPLKQKLIARLFQNSTGKAIELNLKPSPKGAYNGWFVVADSFKTDDELGLYLLTEKRQGVIYKSVKIENYELNDISFTTRQNKNSLSPGSGISIFGNALNKAGLPLLDGNIKLELSLNSINYAAADSWQISMEKMRHFYSTTLQTDPSGTTEFKIPADIFPDINGQYTGILTLTTAENEVKPAYIYFGYETTRITQEAKIENDTLIVNSFYNMQPQKRKMRIQLFSRHDLLSDSSYTTPIKIYLAPNLNFAVVLRGDTQTATLYRTQIQPEIKGKRTHDSIKIEFHSKPDIPVYYRIYKNNELVASGNDTALNYKAADKSKHSYHLQYGTLAGKVSNPEFYSQSFHLAEKELTVKINQPEIIYPGQEVAVEIRVTNAFGKAAKKVNLTAWAMNTQLEGIEKPDVPFMGKIKTQKALPIYYFRVSNFEYTHYSPIRPWQLNTLKLYEYKRFHVVYPINGFEVLSDTAPDSTTQVTFLNYFRGTNTIIKYVKFNDTFVYIHSTTPKPEVIKIRPGTYDMTVRFPGRLVNFKNVKITAGKKNFVCFNLDSLIAKNAGDTAGYALNRYSKQEFDEVMKHSMLLRFDYWVSDTLIVKVNGNTQFGIRPGGITNALTSIYTQRPKYNVNSRQTEYENIQGFYLLGPLNKGDLVTVSWKNSYSHEFVFDPEYTYSFTAKEMVTRPKEEIRSGHQYFEFYTSHYFSFLDFWWNPEKKHVPVVQKPEEYQRNNSTELAEFTYQNYTPNVKTKLSYLHVFLPQYRYIKKLWLFNVNDSSLSFLNNYPSQETIPGAGLESYRHVQAHLTQGKSNQYWLVMQENDSNWLVKSLKIDSSIYMLYTFKNSDFRKLKTREFILFDRMAKILGRQPFAVFEDTPTINKDLSVLKISSKNGKTSIEGTVNGPDLKYVVNNAFVILERNGYFVKGAVTNSDGRFLMDSLLPGNYMLKIKGSDYHYWINYEVNLEKGKTHLLHVKMKPYSRFTFTTMDEKLNANYEWNYSNNYMSDGSASATAPMSYDYTVTEGKSIRRMAAISARGRKFKQNAPDFDGDGDGDDAETAYENTDDGDIFQGNISYKKAQSNYPGKFGDNNTSQADSIMINKMAGDPNAIRIRQRFQDHAYWIPNLTTDKTGFATYAVRFPDNITTWQTYVPAMDGKRHSGLGELTVKAYKPVSSGLAMPYFLTEGDAFYLFGRINNYTKSGVSGEYTLFKDSVGITKNINIQSSYKDSLLVKAGDAGQRIWLQNGFSMNNGYRDIQKRELWVMPASVRSGYSNFFLLKKDTILRYKGFAGDESQTVTVYNQQLAMLFDLLKENAFSIYPDNQSIADELDKLLTEKLVADKLGFVFEKDKEVKECIKKLRNAQSNEGTFGIFRRGKADKLITTYVAEILFKAHNMGYNNNAWLNVARYYEKSLPYLYEEQALHALYSLKKMERQVKYDDFLPRIDANKLGLTDQLKYQILLTRLEKKADISVATNHLKPSAQGNISVQENKDYFYRYHPYFDNSANTYLAWELLYLNSTEKEARNLMSQWMANEAGRSTRNMARSANMLLLDALATEKGAALKPEVTINGMAISAQELPKTISIKNTDTCTIAHKGAPVYVLQNRHFKTYNPVSDTQMFRLTYSLDSNRNLTSGVMAPLKVTVTSMSRQSNVILEIPIPAGCVVAYKIQNEKWFEAQREYGYDRVYIYLDELPFGIHDFNLQLLPKFSGNFNIPPARVALMFYPEQSAYTSKTNVVIE